MSGILPKSPPPQNLTAMDAPVEQVNTRPAPITTRLNETFALNIQKQLNREERTKAVDIRPQSSALLTINSADRYLPYNNRWNTPDLSGVALSSPYDFVIPLKRNIMSGFFTRIALTSFQMPFTVPIICGKTNGIYIWYQPGGTGAVTQYLVQIGLNAFAGYKDLAGLLTGLQGRVRTVTSNSGFTWAVNGTNGAVANSNNSDKFYFTRWDNPDVPGAATFFDLLNIQATQILSTTSYSYPELIPTQYIDIVCDQLTQSQNLKDASTGGSGKTLLKRIYLFGDNTTTLLTATSAVFTGPVVIQKSYAVPKYINWNSEQNIGALRIQVLDDRGVVLTCGNTNGPFVIAVNEAGHMFIDENMSDWSMEIMLSEV
jgi:hypothetical protein